MSALAPVLLSAALVGPPAGAAPASSGSCQGPGDFGAVYLGSTWPGGFEAVPVYSNGVSGSVTDCMHSTRTPSGKLVPDGYEWQCVELVDRLYLAKGWIASTWLGNGNQMYATAPSYLKKQPQGSITGVGPGDVISFDDPWGGSGHAAVIARVQGNYLTIVNQNTPRAFVISNAHLVGGSIEMVGWAGWSVVGVVDAPAPEPPPLGVKTAFLARARINDPFEAQLAASGGTGRDIWSVAGGALPAGLHLWNWGVVSGIALSTGSYSFVAQVRDSRGAVARRTLLVDVSPNADLFVDPNFTRRHIGPWVLGHKARATTLRHAGGVPGGAGDELVLSTRRPDGSLHQDVRTEIAKGSSFNFAIWVRSLDPGTTTSICALLIAMPHLQAGRTCTSVSSRWTHVLAPYDATRHGERVLRAEVYIAAGSGRVALARAELGGNALRYASFEAREARDWTIRERAPHTVTAAAFGASGLPEGSDFLRISTRRGTGSVFQDVVSSIPAGQVFRFSALLRRAISDPTRQPVEVCLVVSGLRRGQSVSRCLAAGTSWTQLSLAYRVRRRGEPLLRVQICVRTLGGSVDVDAAQLINAG